METKETKSFRWNPWNFEIPWLFHFHEPGNGNVSDLSMETEANFDPWYSIYFKQNEEQLSNKKKYNRNADI